MADSFKVSVTLPTTPKEIYNAWLDSSKHSEFTESEAKIEKKVGSEFTAGNGYISGKNILLHMNKRIHQSWRTTDFPEDAPDSKVEISFEPVAKGTKLTIVHSNLPEGEGTKYKKGWKEHYFAPMKKYFGNQSDEKETESQNQ